MPSHSHVTSPTGVVQGERFSTHFVHKFSQPIISTSHGAHSYTPWRPVAAGGAKQPHVGTLKTEVFPHRAQNCVPWPWRTPRTKHQTNATQTQRNHLARPHKPRCSANRGCVLGWGSACHNRRALSGFMVLRSELGAPNPRNPAFGRLPPNAAGSPARSAAHHPATLARRTVLEPLNKAIRPHGNGCCCCFAIDKTKPRRRSRRGGVARLRREYPPGSTIRAHDRAVHDPQISPLGL